MALALGVCLLLGMAGCTTGADGAETAAPKDRAAAAAVGKAQGETSREQSPNGAEALAELQGQHGLRLTLTAAERDAGGFLTVRGTLSNDSAETVEVPAGLRGNEQDVLRNGQSLGGATLVDQRARKRYYVLRDTDGRPLTTMGLSSLKPGEHVRVFMQFPEPPAGTRHMGFHLPQFDTATIRITP
ncbi:hypothetical protein [Streptomyces cadmiisoli]|uniref:DUF3426 domain-containing protein n=1 Tax=Streptomyces cadmiisoli TaxID=2184053 RepID=A0A2Z4JEL5_9ACTN|nr:hypothetical protein [Streptomyces cadmiisoli]AWW42943.1 hypothetical protein DN051_38820 [Streptomyces cadmiisoli]